MPQKTEYVTLAHGDGGLLTRQLIADIFLHAFYGNEKGIDALPDAAPVNISSGSIAVSTDSFVVSPLFFPGGDIGKLAVSGTVNDLAVSGASPICLTAGFIIEEGLPMAELKQIAFSMAREAAAAGVNIIAGDTKVVEKNKGDGLFINTTGIGSTLKNQNSHLFNGNRIQPGDAIIINGEIGCHGIAVLSKREGIAFETTVKSDCACLHGIIGNLLGALETDIKYMRDPTRGGLATTLKEIAMHTGLDFILNREEIPVSAEVENCCELLGLDPFYLANEGKFVAIVSANRAEEALAILRRHPLGENARIMGSISSPRRQNRDPSPSSKHSYGQEIKPNGGRVLMHTAYGGTRELNFLTGDPLPRIC